MLKEKSWQCWKKKVGNAGRKKSAMLAEKRVHQGTFGNRVHNLQWSTNLMMEDTMEGGYIPWRIK